MSIKSKKEALENVRVRETGDGAGGRRTLYEAYLGTDPFTGKPIRKYASSTMELKRRVGEYYSNLSKSGEAGAALSRTQAMDAKMAYDLLREASSAATLTEAVRAYLAEEARKTAKNVYTTTLADAYEKFCASVAGRSREYRKDIRIRIGKLVEALGPATPMVSVTAVKVKDYLAGRYYDPDNQGTWKTYNNHLGNIRTFFRWCAAVEQRLIPRDPLEGMKMLEIPYRAPSYLPAKDVRKLFQTMWENRKKEPAVLAQAVLTFFCGMRVAEVLAVKDGPEAAKVDLEGKIIRIVRVKGQSRGYRPRTFTIPEQALAWLKAFDFESSTDGFTSHFRRCLMRAGARAGVEIPANAGRHTFITMHTAVHHDPNTLSWIVGNTEDVRARSYNGLASEQEGREYFTILPPPRPSASKRPSSEVGPVPGSDGADCA